VNHPLFVRQRNNVLLFMRMVKSHGGEYVPFREWDSKPKKHTSGRRELRPNLYALNPKKYYTDNHGSIRRREIAG
jgi:hypothetical protein